jgi:hypothetical protein
MPLGAEGIHTLGLRYNACCPMHHWLVVHDDRLSQARLADKTCSDIQRWAASFPSWREPAEGSPICSGARLDDMSLGMISKKRKCTKHTRGQRDVEQRIMRRLRLWVAKVELGTVRICAPSSPQGGLPFTFQHISSSTSLLNVTYHDSVKEER